MKGILKNVGQFVFLHRGCKCLVLYLEVTQTIPISLCKTICSEQTCLIASAFSRLLFCGVFKNYFNFSSTSKTLPQPGHHLPSNTECKAAPSPRRWLPHFVSKAKEGCEGAKVWCSHSTCSQVSNSLMAQWGLEDRFPGAVACTHSFPVTPIVTSALLVVNVELVLTPTVCRKGRPLWLGRPPEYCLLNTPN